jgi:hypothetical protein
MLTRERVHRVLVELGAGDLVVVVPGMAALYEFVVKGRKRLGYRVQMIQTATATAANWPPHNSAPT